jgi:hypothetical protein
MQPLSKAAESKLIAAIERAAGYVNDGLVPNDAIVKSAAESSIPAGHINLMVHAYNTGRTTKQREQSEDTLEKAADFPLADAQTVLDTLYPKAVKTSAALSRACVVSAEYALPVRDMLARRKAAHVKEAAAKISLPEKTWTPPPRDPEAAVRKSASEKRAAELAAEELRRQATMAYSKAAAAMESLHEYFRHPGNMSFQDAVRETELRFGGAGVAVLNKLANVYPHLTKQAATQEVVFGECEPCKLAAAVIDALEAYNAAQASVPVKQAGAKKEAPVVYTGSILHNPTDEPLTLKTATGGALIPFGSSGPGRLSGNEMIPYGGMIPYEGVGELGAPEIPVVRATRVPGTGDSPAARNAPRSSSAAAGSATSGGSAAGGDGKGFGLAGGITSMLQTLSGQVRPGTANDLKQKAYAKLTDPEHETALRNIRAQGILHDLVINDPVISGHDPQEVAMAFNELADVAPQFVDSPATMQALLRKRLESGQMADFDVKQLIDMEKARADTNKARVDAQKIERELI